jgi:hypothetical protein
MQFLRVEMISNKKVVITFRDPQLLCWWFFHTRAFEKLKKIRIKDISSGGFFKKPSLKIALSFDN